MTQITSGYEGLLVWHDPKAHWTTRHARERVLASKIQLEKHNPLFKPNFDFLRNLQKLFVEGLISWIRCLETQKAPLERFHIIWESFKHFWRNRKKSSQNHFFEAYLTFSNQNVLMCLFIAWPNCQFFFSTYSSGMVTNRIPFQSKELDVKNGLSWAKIINT